MATGQFCLAHLEITRSKCENTDNRMAENCQLSHFRRSPFQSAFDDTAVTGPDLYDFCAISQNDDLLFRCVW